MLQLEQYWRGLFEVVGLRDLIDDPRFADGAVAQHFDDMVDELDKAFGSRTLDEWRVELAKQPGQWDVVQHVAELPDDPQARANGFVQTVDYPGGHQLRLVASPVQFDRTASVLGPAPEFGADTDELLAGLGLDDEAIIDAKLNGGVV